MEGMGQESVDGVIQGERSADGADQESPSSKNAGSSNPNRTEYLREYSSQKKAEKAAVEERKCRTRAEYMRDYRRKKKTGNEAAKKPVEDDVRGREGHRKTRSEYMRNYRRKQRAEKGAAKSEPAKQETKQSGALSQVPGNQKRKKSVEAMLKYMEMSKQEAKYEMKRKHKERKAVERQNALFANQNNVAVTVVAQELDVVNVPLELPVLTCVYEAAANVEDLQVSSSHKAMQENNQDLLDVSEVSESMASWQQDGQTWDLDSRCSSDMFSIHSGLQSMEEHFNLLDYDLDEDQNNPEAIAVADNMELIDRLFNEEIAGQANATVESENSSTQMQGESLLLVRAEPQPAASNSNPPSQPFDLRHLSQELSQIDTQERIRRFVAALQAMPSLGCMPEVVPEGPDAVQQESEEKIYESLETGGANLPSSNAGEEDVPAFDVALMHWGSMWDVNDVSGMMHYAEENMTVSPNAIVAVDRRQQTTNRRDEYGFSDGSQDDSEASLPVSVVSDDDTSTVGVGDGVGKSMARFLIAKCLGPTEVCLVCDELRFPKGVAPLSTDIIYEKTPDLFEFHKLSRNARVQLCHTCIKKIRSKSIPNSSLYHGISFPDIPSYLLELSELEHRLIALRIPFMGIRQKGLDRQFFCKGNIVNVPICADTATSVLPRTLDDTYVIQVKIKRRQQYGHSYMYATARPSVIFAWAEWLCKQPLYVLEGVALREILNGEFDGGVDSVAEAGRAGEQEQAGSEVRRFHGEEEDAERDNCDDIDKDVDDPEFVKRFLETDFSSSEGSDEEESDVDPDGLDDELPRQSLIRPVSLSLKTYSLAPGEGKKPISVFTDHLAEEMSFPMLFGGKQRAHRRRLTYHQLCKSELRRQDRRCSKTLSNVIFKHMKLELLRVSSKMSICLRNCKENVSVTSGNLMDPNWIDKNVQADYAYKVLSQERSSPPFWEQKKKELFAMIRQHGKPDLFLTVSAAEVHWNELLVILKKTLDKEEITMEAAEGLSRKEKGRLVRSDPVTTSTYFDYRAKELFKTLCDSKGGGPFGRRFVREYFFRIEFQNRGSPHLHSVVWLNDAPRFDATDPASRAACVSFIDEVITCSEDHDEAYAQRHDHRATCERMRKNKVVCRFNYPKPPMRETVILDPLDENDGLNEVEKKDRACVLSFFNRLYRTAKSRTGRNTTDEYLAEVIASHNSNSISRSAGRALSFQAFLDLFGLSLDKYYRIIRSTIKKPTVFLRRKLSELNVNAYSKPILTIWCANMDIQFCIDAHAVVYYILNYINKTQRGMSSALRKVVDAGILAKKAKKDIFKDIAWEFINSVEVSAQEAVFLVLGLTLSQCTRTTVYINTSPPGERLRLVKSKKKLMELGSDSRLIFEDSLLEHYSKRADELSHLCLAEFASWYTYVSKKPKFECCTVYPQRDGMGFMKKVRRNKVIRFRNFSLRKDSSHYYREHVMLYLPWRNENEEILDKDCLSLFSRHWDIISRNKQQFHHQDIQEQLDAVLDSIGDAEPDVVDDIVGDDAANPFLILQQDGEFVEIPVTTTNQRKNVAATVKPYCKITSINILEDNMFRELVFSLNVKQKRFFYHVLNNIRCGTVFFNVVLGSAGTGKTRLISALAQAVEREEQRKFRSDQLQNDNTDTLHVLLTAPTAIAAFNIGGRTLHNAFRLNPTQRSGISALHPSALNSLRENYNNLKLLIVDEVSLVSLEMFDLVERRLQEIFGNRERMGGISTILFGDLRQLPPVIGHSIFTPRVETNLNNELSVLAPLPWGAFQLFEITEIMRQKSDVAFANALNRLADGSMTDEDVKLMKSREVASADVPVDAVRLYSDHAQVNRYNLDRFHCNQGVGYIVPAIDTISGGTKSQRESAKKQLQELPAEQTCGLIGELHVKVGVKYMLRQNLATEDGLCNGIMGVLRKVDLDEHGKPSVLWLHLFHKNAGQKLRRASALKGDDPDWTPIEKVETRLYVSKHYLEVGIMRKQFPMTMAEAITVHKSQGSTFEKVAVGLKTAIGRKLTRRMLYVALSRATSAKGLYLIGTFSAPEPSGQECPVRKELERLRSEAPVKLSVEIPPGKFHIFFVNIQSIRKNLREICSNEDILKNVDVVFTVENWSVGSDRLSIPLHKVSVRLDGKGNRKPIGASCFATSSADMKLILKENAITNMKALAYSQVIVVQLYGKVIAVCVYKSPKQDWSILRRQLESVFDSHSDERMVVFGDFNMPWVNKSLSDFMTSRGFSLCVPCQPSTNMGTQLDLCFSNYGGALATYYESVFSFHRPILISLGDLA